MERHAKALSWLGAQLLMIGVIGGCAKELAPANVPCVTSSDCEPTERCNLNTGRCEASMTIMTPVVNDGGYTFHRHDSGTMPDMADAGAVPLSPDAASPTTTDGGPANDTGTTTSHDSGTTTGTDASGSVDSGPAPAPDAGCPSPIVVEGSGAQYCTLAAAIQGAPMGSVLDVPANTYAESVTVPWPLTLKGVAGTTIASPTATPPLTITGQMVTIEHIALRAAGGVGVNITGQATLTDVTVSNATNTGVNIAGSAVLTNVVINKVTSGDGIDMLTGSSVTLTGSQILDADGAGLYADGSTVIMHSTQIVGSGTNGCNHNNVNNCAPGLYADRNSSITIDTMSKIDGSGLSGLMIVNGSSLNIQNSDVSNNGTYATPDPNNPTDGLSLGGAGNVTISGCTILGNWDLGVDCSQSSAHCSNTQIKNNGGGGSNCNGC